MNSTHMIRDFNQVRSRQGERFSSLLLIGLIVLLFDQLTKYLTYQFIPPIEQTYYGYPYGGIGVFENLLGIQFSINYLTNTGAAWGLFGHYPYPLIFLRMALIIGMSVYLIFFNHHRSWRIPLVLIISGALGNVLDFFLYGYVVDMLHFVLWGFDFPIFNLADSAISLGIGALFLLSWIES